MSARYVPTPALDLLDHSWTDPLRAVARALRALPPAERHDADAAFDVCDFVIVGRLVEPGRPDIVIAKHAHTQRHLNVDPLGQTYEFVPPPRRSTAYGTYRPHRSLRDAIDHLDLDLLAPARGARRAASLAPAHRPGSRSRPGSGSPSAA